MPNGLHQVRLAHAYSAIEEERVISLGRTFSHGLGRCMGKLVPRANDKCAKSVFGAELRGGIPVETLLSRGRWRGVAAG